MIYYILESESGAVKIINRESKNDEPSFNFSFSLFTYKINHHYYRSNQDVVHQLILWDPNSGKRSISTPVRPLINNDTWIRKEEPGQDIDVINSEINWFNAPKMGC